MKFKKFDKTILCEAILDGDIGQSWEGITLVEEGDWIGEGKYESRTYIFEHEGSFYRVTDSRTGSYYTDYYYESNDWPDQVVCDEVEKVEVVRYEWKAKE